MVINFPKQNDAIRAWEAAAAVLDPEVPALTVAELGILRSVTIDKAGCATVKVTPTYFGCPAMLAIEMAIETALQRAGFKPVVSRVLSPAWTTDWITKEGREKLRSCGIAPPVKGATSPRALFGEITVSCPRCLSANTRKVAEFGSTACKAHYQCNDCAEPFEYFKCI